MGNEVLLRKASILEASEIVELFKTNYKDGYYNQNFSSDARLKILLSREAEFTGIVALVNRKIVGFSGMYKQKQKNMNKVYLSHFLVDKEFRGLGIGNMIEQKKVDLYENLPGKTVVYSILSESSGASIQIKKNFGCDVWGVRLFYGEWEPNQVGNGHLVVVGRTYGFEDIKRNLPNVHPMTQKIIKETVTNSCFIDQPTGAAKGIAAYPESVQYGQYACTVRCSQEGEEIFRIIHKMKENPDYPYIAIRLSTRGYDQAIDDVLLKNNFFPTSFLPYYDDGADVIEYQYISNNRADDLSDYLANKVEMNLYLRSKV